jgi:hypothetical protein
MAGLPKKYARMGFKKGWRAYRAAKAKPRRRKSRRASSKPARRSRKRTRTIVRRSRKRAPVARKVTRRRRRSSRRAGGLIPRLKAPNMRGIQRAGVQVLSGVGGAIGTGAVARMVPVGNTAQAWLQLGTGAAMVTMIPPKRQLLRLAGLGAGIAGALSLVRQAIPGLPLLSGCAGCTPGYMGVNYRAGNLGRLPSAIARSVATGSGRNQAERTAMYLRSRRVNPGLPLLGVNKNFSRSGSLMGQAAGSAGGRFLTSADM